MKRPAPPSPQQSALFVFILVAISLGTRISGFFPTPQSVLDRPWLRESSPRIGTVEVAEVAAYDVYRDTTTNGIFLVVSLKGSGAPEPLSYDARLIDGEGRTNHRHHLSSCGIQQPGLPTPCELAFEVDPEALSGARLHVTRDSVLAERDFLDVDLLLDDAGAARLLADPRRSDYFGEAL